MTVFDDLGGGKARGDFLFVPEKLSLLVDVLHAFAKFSMKQTPSA